MSGSFPIRVRWQNHRLRHRMVGPNLHRSNSAGLLNARRIVGRVAVKDGGESCIIQSQALQCVIKGAIFNPNIQIIVLYAPICGGDGDGNSVVTFC